MSRLRQLLGYLGRDGVSELVLGTGRPIAIKAEGNYKPITAAALTADQLLALVADSPLASQIPDRDSNGTPTSLTIEGRPYRVQVARRSDAILMKIELAGVEQPRAAVAAPAPRVASPPAAVRPTPVRAPTPAPVAEPEYRGVAGIAAAINLELGDSATELELPSAPAPVVSFAAPVAAPVAPSAPVVAPIPMNADRSITVSPAMVALVKQARQRGASDLHVAAGRPAMVRVVGELTPIGEALSADAVQNLLLPLLSKPMQAQLAERGYADFAIDVPSAGRLRANVGKQREGYKGSFRLVIDRVPTLDDLGLPKELAKVTSYHQGLVVIAGPNGHGKTTTLAALVDLINGSKPHHILTVEDPVEVFHPRKMSVVSQREVGTTTRSFASALKASLREDPDVIVIGELRDRETVEIALTAAETGHLVIATMSTPSAAKTIDRLIDMFPPDDQAQVRASLAGALRFIVAQRLLPNAENTGVVPAVELLTGVLPVAALIRDNKLYQLPNVQQRGRAFGMIRFDDSLIELARTGRISEETAVRAAEGKKEMLQALNPAAAAAAAAAAAPAPLPPGAAAKSIDNIKSKFGGLFGKKDKE